MARIVSGTEFKALATEQLSGCTGGANGVATRRVGRALQRTDVSDTVVLFEEVSPGFQQLIGRCCFIAAAHLQGVDAFAAQANGDMSAAREIQIQGANLIGLILRRRQHRSYGYATVFSITDQRATP